MKIFSYCWCDDYYLLHIQFDNPKFIEFEASICRNYQGNIQKRETEKVGSNTGSHRFMISRSHPKEVSLAIEYPDSVILEAFKLDDRAYFPVESFFRQ